MTQKEAREVGRPRGLSPAKREQILEGSRAVFTELGYERASVDAIAAAAGVSKATVYKHFGDKQGLFLGTFGLENEQVRQRFIGLLEEPTGDIEGDLQEIGAQLLRLVSAARQVQRYRVACGAMERFPEVGRALYDSSIKVGRARIVHFIERAVAAGQLAVDSAEEAATDFHALCVGYLTLELHLGARQTLTEAEIAQRVPRAVDRFLRLYRA
ncbi:MAG: TetR/AcrR family transcriptional regulator [Deltaproteobacteria bacterium]|nr:TetR/AcrR family transcriptional regulator [Deltaproteobacteria bacterium]